MEQKPTLSHVISALKQSAEQGLSASSTQLGSPTIASLLKALSTQNETPREPICAGEEVLVPKVCGDGTKFLKGRRLFKVQSHPVAVSEIENSDGDIFIASISALPMFCTKGLHEYDDHLPNNALYLIDWYFEIYQKVRTVSQRGEVKNSMGRRQFYHLLRRQFFKFGEAGLDAFDLQPSSVMRQIASDVYGEIKRRIDEVSIGDEISKKRVQRIVDLNIKRIADEIRMNGDEDKAKWLFKHEY